MFACNLCYGGGFSLGQDALGFSFFFPIFTQLSELITRALFDLRFSILVLFFCFFRVDLFKLIVIKLLNDLSNFL